VDSTTLKGQALKVVEALQSEETPIEELAANADAAAELAKTQKRFQTAFKGRSYRMRAQLAEGPTVVTLGYMEGTHMDVLDVKGLQFDATGRDVSVLGAILLTFDDEGKVLDYKGLYDLKSLLAQMGAQFVIPASEDGPEQVIATVDSGKLERIR
jgi:hypothetical protein